ncbi:hypothetical protein NQ317_019502 [Molorchus minor]|uniref:Uncharacterized protein n=1 Tax=Molorchus minor TaxID=1323400 RepID=A0ABQ9IR92_9CUCU|nr:hypothetical protein NQ317_019502 [Molorchus minor]
MTEIESEPIESNESALGFDDTDPDEIFSPSTSRVLSANKSKPRYLKESDTTSTISTSRCSFAASFTGVDVSRSNMKRCRINDFKATFKTF